jgi:hypothetical protein
MKYVLIIVGVLLLLAGGTFALQGAGILPGSYMSGQAMWLWIGLGMVVVGVGALIAGLRVQRKVG